MRGALLLLLVVGVYLGSPAGAAVTAPAGEPVSSKGLPPLAPTPCKTATQWEGRYSEWDHNSGTNNRYTISFDGVKRRKWVEEEQKSMRPGRRLFKFLILFDEQVEYKIDLKYNKCSKIAIGPWRNFSIPPVAIFEDQYQIGGPQGNLDVVEWSDRQPARSRESWIGGFTSVGCWPVFEIFTFDNATTSVAYTTRFFDLTPGIKNMSVFDVPTMCQVARPDTTTTTTSPGENDGGDYGRGFWDRWVPGWVKNLFDVEEQVIDYGGVVAPLAPNADLPVPEPEFQDGVDSDSTDVPDVPPVNNPYDPADNYAKIQKFFGGFHKP